MITNFYALIVLNVKGLILVARGKDVLAHLFIVSFSIEGLDLSGLEF